jgi:transcription-repair coupling factor (superfamily II helicase)
VQEEDLHFFLELHKNLVPDKKQNVKDDDDDIIEKKTATEEDFIKAGALEQQLHLRHRLEFGHQPSLTTLHEIEFNTKEQPAFNRQFDLLIKDLKNREAKKYEIFLFAENPKQLERLHTIFVDLKADIQLTPVPVSIHQGFIDDNLKVVCYTDHQIFQRYHKYRVKQAYNKNKALTLRTLRELQPGDYVTHIDHGVGVYSGLQKIEANGKLQEAVRIIYKDGDILYVNINSLHKIAKFTGKEG